MTMGMEVQVKDKMTGEKMREPGNRGKVNFLLSPWFYNQEDGKITFQNNCSQVLEKNIPWQEMFKIYSFQTEQGKNL